MNLKIFFAIFATVFLAELGDKTQLATMLFASDKENLKLVVFLAAAAALILSSAVAGLVGHALGKHINPKYLSWIAGGGFIIICIWTITKAYFFSFRIEMKKYILQGAWHSPQILLFLVFHTLSQIILKSHMAGNASINN